MDPREYADARWSALVRAAMLLGASEADAPAVVQRVLDNNRRRIRRAADPDPIVHRALTRAIPGAEQTVFGAEPDVEARREMLIDPDQPPPAATATRRRRRRWPFLAAVGAALVATGIALSPTGSETPPTDRLRSDQVPSLFGYDEGAAQALLESRGLTVTIRPFRSCEVLGRVVASDPPAGTPYDRGDPITVYSSLPADVSCLTDYQDRVTSWQLLDFANGRGPAPAFADRVFVYPGDGPRVVLSAAEAADREGWADTGVLDALRRASERVALVSDQPVRYAVPAIRVIPATEALGTCGVPEPTVAGSADAFSLLIRPPDLTGCPVRVDLYRESEVIGAVALYPSAS